MATVQSDRLLSHHRFGVLRLAATLGISASVLFALCWIATFMPFSSPTHAYIRLFASAPPSSVAALAEGAFWALLFGALSGALISIVYNALSKLEPNDRE